jgi:hypothetical protein
VVGIQPQLYDSSVSMAEAAAALQAPPFVVPDLTVVGSGFSSAPFADILSSRSSKPSTQPRASSSGNSGLVTRCCATAGLMLQWSLATTTTALDPHGSSDWPTAIIRGLRVEVRGPLPERVLVRLFHELRPAAVASDGT